MNATTFTAFALSQLTTSAGHAQELGDSLTPNVLQSDKGTVTQRIKKASSPNALTHLSKDEREELVLNPKRNFTHNFTMDPVPSKVIPRAGRAFATA
jgi:hypothetical protein